MSPKQNYVPADVFVEVIVPLLEMVDALTVTVRAMRLALLEQKSLSALVLNRKQREILNDDQARAEVRAIREKIEHMLRSFEGPVQ